MTRSTSKAAVKKAAPRKTVEPKMTSRKVADGPELEESEEAVPKPSRAIRFTVVMGGEEYTVSATKYKYVQAIKNARDEDDITGADMASIFDGIVSLFWEKDGSRGRVQEALEDESLDLDDLEVVLSKVSALFDKETNRPLG